jgi:hypothetical protein
MCAKGLRPNHISKKLQFGLAVQLDCAGHDGGPPRGAGTRLAKVAVGSLGPRWDRKYSILIMSRAQGAPSMVSKAEVITRHEVLGMAIGGQP